MEQLVILARHRKEQGRPHAKARDDERGAAADADDRHPKALLVAEEIARRDLVDERHTSPQGLDILKEHALARLRRAGAHQARRRFAQRGKAGPERRDCRARDRREHGKERNIRVGVQLDIRHLIHDLIGRKDHLREQDIADDKAQNAADKARQQPVADVLPRDRKAAVAERLERADLHALLFDHARHRRQAHERRDEEKDDRQHAREVRHTVGVLAEARVAGVVAAAEDVPLAAVDIRDLAARVGDLLLRVGDLLVGLRLAVRVFTKALAVVALAVRQFGVGVRELLDAVGVLRFAVVVVLPAVVQLLACVGKFLLRVGELHSGIVKLRFCVVKLSFRLAQLLSARVELGLARVILVPALVQLALARGKAARADAV